METTIARVDSNGVFTTLELQEKPITNNSDQIFGNLVTDSLSGTDKITIYYEGDSTEYPLNERISKPIVSIGSGGTELTKLTESVDQVIYPSNYLDHIKISDDPYTSDNTYIQIMKSDLDNNLVEVGDQIIFNQSRYYDDGMTTRLYTKRAENSLYDASISYFRNDPQDFSFEAIFLKSNPDSPHNDINVLISKRNGSSGSGGDPVSTSGGFHLLQLVFNYVDTQQGYDCYVCDEALSEIVLPISWAQGPQYVSTINSATEILCSQLIESIYKQSTNLFPNVVTTNNTQLLVGDIIKIEFRDANGTSLNPNTVNLRVSLLTNSTRVLTMTNNYVIYGAGFELLENIPITEVNILASSQFDVTCIIFTFSYNNISTEYKFLLDGSTGHISFTPQSGTPVIPLSSRYIVSIDPFVGENQFVTADGNNFITSDGNNFLVK